MDGLTDSSKKYTPLIPEKAEGQEGLFYQIFAECENMGEVVVSVFE